MSFSRGFNNGFSMMLDAQRLRQQEEESKRIQELNERKLKFQE